MSLHHPLNIFVPHCSDLLTDYRPHGDGLIAHGFIRHLAERGHNLYVAVQEIDLRAPLPPNVHVFRMGLHCNHKLSRLQYMLHVRRLFMRLRRRVAFDVVHQMNPVYTGISLSLIRTGIPVVLGTYVARWPDCADGAVSGSVRLRIGSAFRASMAALQQHFADRLLLTAPVAANRLISLGPANVPRSYIPHGIDTELFSPPEKGEIEGGLSVLYLAHLTKRKGILDLIAAFADVVSIEPGCILFIAGTGSEENAVQHLAAQLGISGHIRFLGHVERLSTPEIYRRCSIYCLPSNGEPYATTALKR